MITFEEFQSSRKQIGEIGTIRDASYLYDTYGDDYEDGYIYSGDLTIAKKDAADKFTFILVIENDAFISEDLAELEHRLYEWGVKEGFLT